MFFGAGELFGLSQKHTKNKKTHHLQRDRKSATEDGRKLYPPHLRGTPSPWLPGCPACTKMACKCWHRICTARWSSWVHKLRKQTSCKKIPKITMGYYFLQSGRNSSEVEFRSGVISQQYRKVRFEQKHQHGVDGTPGVTHHTTLTTIFALGRQI